MTLWMKYDDGFVAYLNGTRIATANATLSPAWNAGARGGHDDASAVPWGSFAVGTHINKLKSGNKFLAIPHLHPRPPPVFRHP